MIKNDPECSWIVFLFLHYLFVINQQGESKGEHPFGRVWRGFKGETKVLSRLWRLNFTFKRSANALLAFVAILVYAFAGSPFAVLIFVSALSLVFALWANAQQTLDRV